MIFTQTTIISKEKVLTRTLGARGTRQCAKIVVKNIDAQTARQDAREQVWDLGNGLADGNIDQVCRYGWGG